MGFGPSCGVYTTFKLALQILCTFGMEPKKEPGGFCGGKATVLGGKMQSNEKCGVVCADPRVKGKRGTPNQKRGVPGWWGSGWVILQVILSYVLILSQPTWLERRKHMSGEWQLDSVQSILMRRDGMTRDEARETIRDMQQRVIDGEDPEELLHEIGLEPDYIWDILPV